MQYKGINRAKIPEKPVLSNVRPLSELARGLWLNDLEIIEYLQILCRKYPGMGGLEDPIILGDPKFMFEEGNSLPFVRVVHARKKKHWVCICSGCVINDKYEVIVFDSLASKEGIGAIEENTDPEVLNVIESIFPGGDFNIKTRKCQKQTKSLCGYYALANATALCARSDPTNYKYIEEEMPAHYYRCLTTNKVSEFPRHT